MRKDFVLNDAEKKVRFKRLIKKRQEAQEFLREIPSLEPINLTIAKDQHVSSAISLKVKKAELQDLFDENMSHRLSGLGFLINEVSSGNFQTLRMKILLNSELYMTSISQAAISNYLVSNTLGSLTFINGIPEIPDIDKKILDNVLRIQKCVAMKVYKTCENGVSFTPIVDWYVILQHSYFDLKYDVLIGKEKVLL